MVMPNDRQVGATPDVFNDTTPRRDRPDDSDMKAGAFSPNASVPLDTLAAEINARFKRTGPKAPDHRIAAGLLLAEARKRVEAGEAGPVKWTQWAAEHIERSAGDVRKLQQAARSHLPAVVKMRPGQVPSLFEKPMNADEASATRGLIMHRQVAIKGASKEMARAADMLASVNRILLDRGDDDAGISSLNVAIAVTNEATVLARKAAEVFLRSTSTNAFEPRDIPVDRLLASPWSATPLAIGVRR
jgi:hypothetical protein